MKLGFLKKVNIYKEAYVKRNFYCLLKNFYKVQYSLISYNTKNNLNKFPIKLFCQKNYTQNENDTKSESNSKSDQKKDFNYPEIIKLLFENNILKKKLPCFEVYSSQIEILNTPFDYYLAIVVNIFDS